MVEIQKSEKKCSTSTLRHARMTPMCRCYEPTDRLGDNKTSFKGVEKSKWFGAKSIARGGRSGSVQQGVQDGQASPVLPDSRYFVERIV